MSSGFEVYEIDYLNDNGLMSFELNFEEKVESGGCESGCRQVKSYEIVDDVTQTLEATTGMMNCGPKGVMAWSTWPMKTTTHEQADLHHRDRHGFSH